MLEQLSSRLAGLAARLKGQARITDEEIHDALRELRIALLEADVALPVVRELVSRLRTRIQGLPLARSITPGELVVSAMHAEIARIIGGGRPELDLARIPSVVLLAGLQGAGKTTTAGKLAFMLARQRRKVALASVDFARPAAREQLKALAVQVQVPFIETEAGDPVAAAKEALSEAMRAGRHVLVLDTAGRQAVDAALMEELAAIAAAMQPAEKLLVVDAAMGQAAAEVARAFHEAIGLTGVVLAKADADARGGAALSVSMISGAPVRFLGVGEKLDALEPVDAESLAARILGLADWKGLLARVARGLEARASAPKARKRGGFSLAEFAEQIEQLLALGGPQAIAEHLPFALRRDMAGEDAVRRLRRMRAIIQAMTPEERARPEILNGSRKRRIARGSGVSVQEVNQLLRQHRELAKLAKRMRKGRGLGKLGAVLARTLGR